jgi:hypothetical protein
VCRVHIGMVHIAEEVNALWGRLMLVPLHELDKYIYIYISIASRDDGDPSFTPQALGIGPHRPYPSIYI